MKVFNISEDPKEEWDRIKLLTLDRNKWRLLMEGENMDKAVDDWYLSQRNRRKARMIRKGITPITCEPIRGMDIPESVIRRSPLEEVPIEGDPNLIKKVGRRVAKEIMETHRKTQLNQQVKLDPFEYWAPSCITVWKKQLEPAKKASIAEWKHMDDMERRTRDRKKLVEEWMINSNIYDEERDWEETFVIADIRGYKKVGNSQLCLVEYEPRVLEADVEFPEDFPAVRGKPWPLQDWIALTQLRPRIKENEYVSGRVKLYQEWNKSKVLEDIKRRGTTLGVEGVIGVDEDVG